MYYNNAIKSHFADGTLQMLSTVVLNNLPGSTCRVKSPCISLFFSTLQYFFDLGWPGEKRCLTERLAAFIELKGYYL